MAKKANVTLKYWFFSIVSKSTNNLFLFTALAKWTILEGWGCVKLYFFPAVALEFQTKEIECQDLVLEPSQKKHNTDEIGNIYWRNFMGRNQNNICTEGGGEGGSCGCERSGGILFSCFIAFLLTSFHNFQNLPSPPPGPPMCTYGTNYR